MNKVIIAGNAERENAYEPGDLFINDGELYILAVASMSEGKSLWVAINLRSGNRFNKASVSQAEAIANLLFFGRDLTINVNA